MQFITPYLGYVVLALTAIILGLIAWLVLLHIRLARLVKQYMRLMAGVQSGNLEEVITRHVDEIRDSVKRVKELDAKTRQVERTLGHAMQWSGVVRFNPFQNTGGNQSFAWALIDGHGSGIVLSGLHAREGTRIYAKPLSQWESVYPLTDEEKQAIERACQEQSV